MNSESANKPKPLHFGLAILISLGVFISGNAIEGAFRWTNHLDGFMSGLLHGIIFSIPWCVLFLPWCALIYGMYHWKKRTRFRGAWIIGPSLLVFALQSSSLVFDPPTAQRRFRSFAESELPKDAADLHYRFTGGGLADYGDTYYFRCTPAEVDRLISEMRLEWDEHYQGPDLLSSMEKLPGCPDPAAWTGAMRFERSEELWFYSLLTNKEKTEVYIHIGCI
jgi:hypothetical protein